MHIGQEEPRPTKYGGVVRLGINPIVTLKTQLLNMIGKLV